MVVADAVDGFAALLMALKRRSGLSFETLAHRSGRVSASTIHRYCRGQGVPTEYEVVEWFAKSCGRWCVRASNEPRVL